MRLALDRLAHEGLLEPLPGGGFRIREFAIADIWMRLRCAACSSLGFAYELATGRSVGLKLGPGFDRDLIPSTAEAQWVSADGQVVESDCGSARSPARASGAPRSCCAATRRTS